MPENAKNRKPVIYTKSDLAELQKLVKAQKSEQGLVHRARITLLLIKGRRVKEVATEMDEGTNTITIWRDRFNAGGSRVCPTRRTVARPEPIESRFSGTR